MEFDLPIRIHWMPNDPVSRDQVESIRRCRPLAVTLEIERIGQLARFGLPWDGVSLVIVYRGWRDPDQNIVTGLAKRWEFPVHGPHEAQSLANDSFLGLTPAEAAFSWFPRRGKMADLLPILETAARTGCGLTLPNRPAGVIKAEGSDAFPGAGELTRELLSELEAVKSRLRPDQVRVHDFILTKALDLGGIEPQGCEAANSVAFIDPEGRIYPCQTLMIPMGDLNRDKLDDVWASEIRKRVRQDVGSLPRSCSSCPCLDLCQGGCRGAAYHFAGNYGAPDPLCPFCAEDHNE
jgi:radical SAM protein with 4Fe4S-binding SPASM domain